MNLDLPRASEVYICLACHANRFDRTRGERKTLILNFRRFQEGREEWITWLPLALPTPPGSHKC
jgi:hypothetical protein